MQPNSISRILLLAVSCLLSACASYHATSDHPATLRTSSVSRPGDGSEWDTFEIRTIDGKNPGPAWFRSDIKVDPGQRFIVIYHSCVRGHPISRNMSAGELLLKPSLRPGRNYEVTGEGDDTTARTWIRDLESGAIVSGMAGGHLTLETP